MKSMVNRVMRVPFPMGVSAKGVSLKDRSCGEISFTGSSECE